MNNYLKGFMVSTTLHLAALGLILAVAGGGLFAEREVLLVDFSSIAIGAPQEGGDVQGPGGAPETAEPEPEAPAPPKPKMPPIASKKASPAQERPAEKPKQTAPTPAAHKTQPGAGGGGSPQGRGSGPGSGVGAEQGLAQSYVKANYNYILMHISRNFEYPSQARRMGLSGTATFSFIIQKDGHIQDLQLDKSSGHRILDEAVEKAITRAAPFPPPPVPARLIIPIRCRLT